MTDPKPAPTFRRAAPPPNRAKPAVPAGQSNTAAHGAGGISVRMVAASAGVTAGLVTHYFGGQSNFWAKIAAMSVLGTIPVFFTVAVMQRYLVRGISMGAVKG